MLGFPVGYTINCVPKNEQKSVAWNDTRLSLLGNTWCVQVIAVLLGQLFSRLGWIPVTDCAAVVNACRPGQQSLVQGRLLRLPLGPQRGQGTLDPQVLSRKLANLVSIKGEDIMLTSTSSQLVRYHRLRASVPSKLWRWGVVAGWQWKGGKEHINSLELRAIVTSFKWRLQHQRHFKCRLVHLTDSLVCLHALSRGRSSSRKLRRSMAKLNSLVLVTGVQPVWGYLHTSQNPADRPSRWGQRVRSKFRNAAKTPA